MINSNDNMRTIKCAFKIYQNSVNMAKPWIGKKNPLLDYV